MPERGLVEWRDVGIKIIMVMLAVAVLAGCAAPDKPAGAPGSATISLHGRIETGFGAVIR
jgi:hypothetical protein